MQVASDVTYTIDQLESLHYRAFAAALHASAFEQRVWAHVAWRLGFYITRMRITHQHRMSFIGAFDMPASLIWDYAKGNEKRY